MTKVFVHGKLGKEFGTCFSFSISKPKDAISAINANHDGFEKRMIDMARGGAQYTLIADDQIIGTVSDFVGKRKIKEIHIVPTIFGAGAIAAIVGGALIAVVAYAAEAFIGEVIASILVAVAFAAISYGVQSLLAKPPSQNTPGGGNPSTAYGSTSATSRSFLFSNKENITQQGNPVPLGYGRLRIGSAVIQQSIKNYPNSLSTFDEFVNQATQEGQGSMAIINNQQV